MYSSLFEFRLAIITNDYKKAKDVYNKLDDKNQIACKGGIPNLILALNSKSYKIIKFILEKNIENVNDKFSSLPFEILTTPLIFESRHGNRQNIYTLLNYGANIYDTDNNGKNALYYAKLNRYNKIIRLLEKKHQSNKDELFEILYKKITKLDKYCIENIIKYVYSFN